MKKNISTKKETRTKRTWFYERMKTEQEEIFLKARRAKGRKKIKHINISPQFSGLF